MFMFVGKQKFVQSIFMNAPGEFIVFFVPKLIKKLKAFFHDKLENDSDSSNKDTFETLQIQKSKWTPPEGKFASLDFFHKKMSSQYLQT